jgi:hypothetical protein
VKRGMTMDVLIAAGAGYGFVAVSFAFIRWVEWDDNNLLRVFLIGLNWPVVVLFYVFKASKGVVRYMRGRFWDELAEVLPQPVCRELPPDRESDHEYVEGQWR